MTSIVEKTHTGGFILSEGDGNISREEVTVITGQNLQAGTVLGIITASGKATILAPAAPDGSENAAGILLGPVDATGADVAGAIIARYAEVIADELTWPGGISGPQKVTATSALKALGIISR